MALRVLIASDKFKGTLTAAGAVQAIARGWRLARPEDRLELLPISDGGDGFGQVLAELFHLQSETVRTVDAAHRPHEGRWWWHPERRLAVIESAQVVGLAVLPPGRFHPFELDTFGLGAVLQAGREAGAIRTLIGIGGSATNDGGFGLARALGWGFHDDRGTPLERWTDLDRLDRILPPRAASLPNEWVVAVDVQNPLLGEGGATRIYGPQKGLRPQDIPRAEACLARLVEKVRSQLDVDAAAAPGAGAAGGLGYGLRCFCQARLESGFALVAEQTRLEERIRSADLVITGEGALDASSLMGKGAGEVALLCRKLGVRCLGLAGCLTLKDTGTAAFPFHAVYGIVPELASLDEAMKEPERWVERLAALAGERETEGTPPPQ